MLRDSSPRCAGSSDESDVPIALALIEQIIHQDATGAAAQNLGPITTGLQQQLQAQVPGATNEAAEIDNELPSASVQFIGIHRNTHLLRAMSDFCLSTIHPPPKLLLPTADKALIRRHTLCTINPPDINATFDENGMFIEKALPGMTRLVLGIPYIQRVDGIRHHTVTVAVAQTSESLKRFGNGIADRVKVLESELYLLAFGSNPNYSSANSICALYRLGLKRNDRSSKPTPGTQSYDGSYSLASTVEKGQGQGCFQPAVQASTPAAQKLIRRTLDIVHELQQLIMPCCLSKFEWEVTRFICDDNNVFVFGGLGLGATGLQMNVSSGIGELKLSIGGVQGDWHTDYNDDEGNWTMAIMMLKLPPGSDPGPFMLGRFGLYIRETSVLIIYLIFRGNDLHSGYHPAYLPSSHQAWIDKEAVQSVYDLCAPEQRIVLVPYATGVAVDRTAEVAVTPPLTFMNLGAAVPHKIHTQNFSQHGKTILGNSHARYSRLSREILWGMLNALKYAGITLDMAPSDLFQKAEV
ncbi:hypothetical protein MSAN_00352400 [Mycena sanguinolenta]|uniref:Uncharacterized protein n=1 Tax=Mycena sanguinolenta TaxID=230812 RepID=A0A8H6ZCC5_9AGAR|nr:hypothetical protein MSAN_00352400 [Mycena sanguinolenta]